MDFDRLLDTFSFNLEEFVEKQEHLLKDGVFFKVSFKKKIKHFDMYQIASGVFRNNFISLTNTNQDKVFREFYKFDRKNGIVPFFIKRNTKLSFYIMDSIADFSFKDKFLEESNHSVLESSHFSSNVRRYYTNIDVLNAINQNHFFYIKIEGLESFNPLDFNYSSMIEDQKKMYLTHIVPNLKESLFNLKIKENLSKKETSLIMEIEKLQKILEHHNFYLNELIQIYFFLILVRISSINLLVHNTKSLNIKKIIDLSKKKSQLYLSLDPKNETRTYDMFHSRGNFFFKSKKRAVE